MSPPFLLLFLQCLSTANEIIGKKFCNESSTRGNVLEILKKILLESFSLPNEFFNFHPFGFCPTRPFITPSLTTDVSNELL
jgi:hypothetical protein